MAERGRPPTKTKDGIRTCTLCSENKSLSNFYGRNSYCKPCFRDYQRSRYTPSDIESPTRYESEQEAVRRRKYGLRKDQYEEMLKSNNGVCPGCKRTPGEFNFKWCVDHCHDSGKVRGIICNNCNLALGMVRDERETLERLKEYLR